jgi:hypothetical protein
MNPPQSNQAPLSEMGISWRDLGVDAGLQGGAAFVVADEVPANLFDATCAWPICPRSVIYIAHGAKQKAL